MKSKPIFNANSLKPILRGRIPGQLIIQYTDFCNATCPQCSMRKTEAYQRSKLPEEEVRRIIDAAADQNIQSLSFTGGETFIFQEELLRLINYATAKKIPLIRTGTNGFFFTGWNSPDYKDKIKKLAADLAQTNLRNLWISIDSADPETHEKMRGLPGVIKGIEIALPIFHEQGIYPAANLGINRNIAGSGQIPAQGITDADFYQKFRDAFASFYSFIIDLGFTMTNACYPMSVDEKESPEMSAVYGASAQNEVISFSHKEKIQLFKALMDTIPLYRSQIRIFTPRSSLYSLIRQYQEDAEAALPCRGGIDFFFIDARQGNTYPCGYRGNENLGKFYGLDWPTMNQKPFCKACDWECFRDPSELIGFAIETLKNPLKLLRAKDPLYKQLWWQDLRYYRACDYFDGRKPSKDLSKKRYREAQ